MWGHTLCLHGTGISTLNHVSLERRSNGYALQVILAVNFEEDLRIVLAWMIESQNAASYRLNIAVQHDS